ncbi:MAG: FimV family protein [Pseudomonadales bacterium]|nr:FimV family protein [Pseudomonadales bacterium]
MMKRFSNSTAGILLISGLLQSQVMALGLGDIELKSALNQPFDATIQLNSTGGLTEDEIIITLASKKDFERVGVDRFFYLTELKFGVYIESDNAGVIHITTKHPVNEPYLDFIVETQWPTGRMLREYTVLLDPPVFIEAPVTPVQAPMAKPVAVTAAPTTSSAPAPTGASSVRNASRSMANADGGFIRTTNETLWEVALKVRPNSEYSVQQTMLAIQDQNPRAFMRGNINLIKQHQKLKVPTASQIHTRSLLQAERDVALQNKMFEEGRRLPTKPKPLPMVAAAPASTANASSTAGDQPELKLLSATGDSSQQAAGGVSSGSSTGTPAALEDALAISEENLDKSEQEKLDLSTRMADLEKNLATMQKLLQLKDEQMALLQAELEESNGIQPSALATSKAELGMPVDAQVTDTTDTTTTDKPAANYPVIAPSEVSATNTASIVPASEDADVVTPEPAPKVAPEPMLEAGWLSVVKDNLYLVGAAIAMLVLALVVALRRKGTDDEEGIDSDYSLDNVDIPLTDSDFNEEGLEDISGFDDVDQLEAEFVPDDLVTEPEPNADVEPAVQVKAETSVVLAEADIYLAYGRAQPAIDILTSAIQEEPARTDLRLKLLEVYADQNNSRSFDQELSGLAALNDDAASQQAAELRTRMVVEDEDSAAGDELVFDFYQSDDETPIVESTEDSSDEIPFDDGGVLNTVDFEPQGTESNDLSTETESDSGVSSLEKSIAEHESRDGDEIGEIDFDVDMSDFDLSSTDDLFTGFEESTDNDATSADKPEEDADLDSINMQMKIEAEAIVAKLQEQDFIASTADINDEDDLDLDSLHMQMHQNVAAELEPETELNTEATLGVDVNDDDADIDLSVDESETKIDLARAYIEMEDFEGAQELLKEVQQEGSAEQKTIVAQLLEEMS